MDDFTEKVIIVVLDKLAIGFLILLVGYFITKAVEKFKGEQALLKEFEVMRDRTALQHLQRQIEELYSPLLGLIQHSDTVFKIAQEKIPLKTSPEDIASTQNYFIEEYYLPLNSQMATILRTKIYLLDTDELPDSFKRFLEHESQFSALHRLWKDKNIRSDDIEGLGWPQDFEKDVSESLNSLRKRYNYYLKRLENDNKTG